MGINGLWKIVAPASQQDSFRGLAARYGYRDGSRGLRVGIDASIWIATAIASTRIGSIHSQTENAALKQMFYRFCKLLEVPATFIFVFDGPARPARKRGKQVSDKAVWLTRYLKEMVPLFGFHHHQAPGEAEAELAQLNRADYIDVIVSDDSDTLVFGGLNVLRMLSASDPDSVAIYHADVIELSDDVNLSRGGMVFFALCSGGDYSPGIRGCGPTIAHALAKVGFGDRLFAAMENLDGPAFFAFLRSWRDELRRVLRLNIGGALSSSHPSVAGEIDDDFPNLALLELYSHPTTSFTLRTPPPTHLWHWLPQQPNLLQLAQFSCRNFGWNDETILKRFRERLWRGIALSMFTFPLAVYNENTGRISTPRFSTQIVQVVARIAAHGNTEQVVKVKLTTDNFIASLGPRWQLDSPSARPMAFEIPHRIFDKLAGPPPPLPIEDPVAAPSSMDLVDSEMEEDEVVADMALREVIVIDDSEDEHSENIIDPTV